MTKFKEGDWIVMTEDCTSCIKGKEYQLKMQGGILTVWNPVHDWFGCNCEGKWAPATRDIAITKANLRVGDLIGPSSVSFTRKIQAIADELFAISKEDEHDVFDRWVAFADINKSWIIKLPPSEAPATKMTVAEVAKKLGHAVEIVEG